MNSFPNFFLPLFYKANIVDRRPAFQRIQARIDLDPVDPTAARGEKVAHVQRVFGKVYIVRDDGKGYGVRIGKIVIFGRVESEFHARRRRLVLQADDDLGDARQIQPQTVFGDHLALLAARIVAPGLDIQIVAVANSFYGHNQ